MTITYVYDVYRFVFPVPSARGDNYASRCFGFCQSRIEHSWNGCSSSIRSISINSVVVFATKCSDLVLCPSNIARDWNIRCFRPVRGNLSSTVSDHIPCCLVFGYRDPFCHCIWENVRKQQNHRIVSRCCKLGIADSPFSYTDSISQSSIYSKDIS